MGAIITVYCFYFFLLLPAAVWFLRRCVITDTLKNLRGLSAEVRYNQEDNSVSVKNNFVEFYLDVPNTLRKSFPLLVLQQICADIEEGKNYSSAWYLSRYKKYHAKFLTAAVLASFAAPLLAFFTAGIAGDSEYIAEPLIAFQSVLFLLTGVLRSILARNFDSFTEIFYKQWYDVLLNFDAMRNTLCGNFFEGSGSLSGGGLANTLRELQNVYSFQIDFLSKAVAELASSLQKLADEKQKGEIVTVETVINFFDINFKRIEGLCVYFESAVQTLETSYKSLLDFSGKNKNALNAVNNMAGEFAELRNALLAHTNAAENAAIERLNTISASLENDVRKTWTTIEETLTKNAQDLFKSYGHFFELFKAFSSTAAKDMFK